MTGGGKGGGSVRARALLAPRINVLIRLTLAVLPLPQFERQDPDLKTQSHCAFQASQGNPGIGPATIFVSWGLASTLFGILQRLEEYVEEKGLDADKTFFWICDFSVRQTPGPGKVGGVGLI